MYLNIVNNLSFENKKNRNNFLKKDDESKDDKLNIKQVWCEDSMSWYNSIFYGQLTENWLKVTN